MLDLTTENNFDHIYLDHDVDREVGHPQHLPNPQPPPSSLFSTNRTPPLTTGRRLIAADLPQPTTSRPKQPRANSEASPSPHRPPQLAPSSTTVSRRLRCCRGQIRPFLDPN
ncbi:hypothetical protein Droror1_Dr00017588 [Drosera rotundifolia]